uniref:Innexin n=2 Tax=Hirudo TaxID=6420 RepID=Q38HR2_HIRME|nr:innexin 9 [Hirudo medicinalis]AFC34068.1 INX9A [Hirudo verbana]
MDKLFGIFGDISHTKLGGADSFSDQLNCKHTVYILSLVAILSTTRFFVDDPITCHCPNQFTSSQVDYTEKVCWVTNTHYVPFDRAYLPKEGDPNKKFISYYQWIPLFLALQALLFYLPRFTWKNLSRKSGLIVSNITDGCIECQKKAYSDGAEKVMDSLIKYMSRFLREYSRNLRAKKAFQYFFRGNYLILVYALIKILYLANVIGQLFLLNAFLGNEFHIYGIEVIRKMLRDEPWSTSHRFPRVTICDFELRVLGNVHRHTVQCVLPMNLFYEIIFIFIWFWFVLVAVSSLASLVFWLGSNLRLSGHESYIRQRLLVSDKLGRDQRRDVLTFVRDHLRRDGCFIVRMAAENSNDLVTSELIHGLWEDYKTILSKTNNNDDDESAALNDEFNVNPRKSDETSNIGVTETRRF